MAKKTIKYSKKDGLEKSHFAVSKVRITTMIDKDLLDWLKREAEMAKLRRDLEVLRRFAISVKSI